MSNLGPDHYCGAIAAVVEADGAASQREVMFLLRCDAPGVEMRECPSFSAMEGTGTYALRLTPFPRMGAGPTPWPTLHALSSPASALRL